MPLRPRRTFLGLLGLLGLAAAGCGGAPVVSPRAGPPAPPPPPPPQRDDGPPRRRLRLPPRGRGARGAREVFDEVDGLGAGERERAIAAELVAGNVPAFLRTLVPIALGGADATIEAYAFVTPDVVCLGSDDDFVRIPITMRTAREVCDAASALPPTRALVDAIYAAAPHKIPSPTMTPGAARPADFLAHHEVIERRLAADGGRPGQLVAGHKKDIVIAKRMLETSGRTAIYGWMLRDGSVVQPLSLVHDDRFVDYVQGLRLVDRRLWIEGRDVDLLDALADPDLAPLLSDEGAYDLRAAWERGW
jgi:hypothetical protein